MKDSKQRGIFNRAYITIIALLILFGCVTVKKYYLKATSSFKSRYIFTTLDPSTQGLNSWKELIPSLTRSLEYVSSKPENDRVFSKYINLTWGELKDTLTRLLEVLPLLDQHPELLFKKFKLYQLIPDPLFTGYYEPLVKASLTPRPDYPYPIYGLPKDLKKVNLGVFHPKWRGEVLVYRIDKDRIKPYYTREEIEKKRVLEKKAPKIAWVRDLIDLYFLQVQGSGRLLLPDGEVIHIGYAGKNGRPFVPIGKSLVETGLIKSDKLSMKTIRDFFRQHPALAKKLIYRDPSYVFFRLLPDGPVGAMGKKLTPYVSLATDPSILPLGSVVIFFLDLPRCSYFSFSTIKGIGLPQDTGGAIKGHRIDLFCGFGDRAEFVAGHLKRKGKVFLLLKK